jgi:lipoyl(octanoyl) transferase
MANKQECEVEILGQVDYMEAWALQNHLADEIGRGQRLARLLLLEHPPTYTFGRRGKTENLLWNERELARRGIQLHWVDRGGDVTYHGPGQLVGYPLLPIGTFEPQSRDNPARLPRVDTLGYLRKLEQVIVQALAELEFSAHTLAGMTGVWVVPKVGDPPAKIAAIGVKVDARGVTRHGFALNVNMDMEPWQGIIACGLENSNVTSLAKLTSGPPTMDAVQQSVMRAFSSVFGFAIKFV